MTLNEHEERVATAADEIQAQADTPAPEETAGAPEPTGHDAAVDAVRVAMDEAKAEPSPAIDDGTGSEEGDELPPSADGDGETTEDLASRGDENEDEDEDTGEDEEVVEFDDELLARGAALGFSSEDAEQVGSPEAFEKMLEMFQGRVMALAAQPPGQAQPPQGAQPPQQQPPPQGAQPPADAPDSGALTLELDPEKFDEDLVGVFAKVNTAYQQQNSEVAQLKQAVGMLVRQSQQQQAESAGRRLDALFDGLGEDFETIIGKGPTTALKTSDNTYKVREQIINHMAHLTRGMAAGQLQIPPEEQLFKLAVNAICGSHREKMAQKKVSTALKKRSKMHVSRPTQRKGPPPTSGKNAAVEAVAELMQEMDGV